MQTANAVKTPEEARERSELVLAQDAKMLTAQKGDLSYKFSEEELFLKFMCNVHPWMFGYVNVMSHPFFAVSSKDGTFTIKDLPAGKYTIEAYHRKAGKQTMEVEVPATGKKEVNFTFDAK